MSRGFQVRHIGVLVAAGCTLISPPKAFALDCGTPVSGESITLERVQGGFSRPVDMVSVPGDNDRLFIVEQTGTIAVVDLSTRAVVSTFLNIESEVACCGERGLLGLAFHPEYDSNGLFYVNYTRASGSVCSSSRPPGCSNNRNSETVIARYRVSDADPDVADPDSRTILLTFCQPYSNHNGGQIAFGPHDGYLYIGTGDGGSGGDPCGSGQRTDSLLGKLLRIDVDRRDGGLQYAIPADNPFVDDGSIRPEIWALGLRNPWRFDFDTESGDLYIGDVGQGSREEIDHLPGGSPGGANFQWRRREGDRTYDSRTSYGPGTPSGPVYEYSHGAGVFRGCSVTGGVVYPRGRMPDLHGRYFFADWCNDWVGSFRVENGDVIDLLDHTAAFNEGIAPARIESVSAFGTDGRGEVYVADHDGIIYRIVSRSCRVSRRVPRSYSYGEADPVRVTLDAVYISRPTTVIETIPEGWSFNDPGGGSIDGRTVAFEIEADVQIVYEVVPGPLCETVEFAGAITGDGCDTVVRGSSSVECLAPSFTLVDEGDTVAYFPGETEPPTGWRARGFDDGDWSHGDLGIGYGDGDDATILDDMRNRYVSVYCRMIFDLADQDLRVNDVTRAELAVRFDDGVVLHLNGTEIGRANMAAGAVSNTTTAAVTVGNAASVCDILDGPGDSASGCVVIPLPLEYLVGGENVLAASVHNASPSSSDLTFIPTLVARGSIVPAGALFRRGDVDDNGTLEVTDAVHILLWLFAGAGAPGCFDSADVDNNGSGEISDVVGLLGYLFQAGPPPMDPGPTSCGLDDEPDAGCDDYRSCDG